MKLKELLGMMDGQVEVCLSIAHPDLYCVGTVQSYANTIRATLNDGVMSAEVTGIRTKDDAIWVDVEVEGYEDT